jgi:hypothetical protein
MRIKDLDEKRILHKCLTSLGETTELILKVILPSTSKEMKTNNSGGNAIFHNANLIYSVSIPQGKGDHSLSIIKSSYLLTGEETFKFKTEKELLEMEDDLIKKHKEKSGYPKQIIETIEL